MLTAAELRQESLRRGMSLKRTNAITATLSGMIPAIVMAHLCGTRHIVAGFVLGVLWANAFEYAYHRWLLHWPQSSFGKNHLMHHMTSGAPNEAEHLTFGGSPLYVLSLFALNGIPAVLIDLHWHVGIASGLFLGWAAYFVAVEEIHWRVHLGAWLPPGLTAAREYHLAHHDVPGGRFNVFFPVFDYVFGNIEPEVIPNPTALPSQEPLLPSWYSPLPMLYMLGVAIAIRFVFDGGRPRL